MPGDGGNHAHRAWHDDSRAGDHSTGLLAGQGAVRSVDWSPTRHTNPSLLALLYQPMNLQTLHQEALAWDIPRKDGRLAWLKV